MSNIIQLIKTWPFKALDIMSEDDAMLRLDIARVKFDAGWLGTQTTLGQMLSQKLDKEITGIQGGAYDRKLLQ